MAVLDLHSSIERRLGLLEDANADPQLRAIVLAHCKNDVVSWCNDWVWTVDPRRSPATLPFDLFPRQAEFLLWLDEQFDGREDAIAEKSRDVGFTWLCCAWAVHHWLFYPGFKATFGSRKKTLVDRVGDPDSIFEKMRLLLRSLPWWMLPSAYSDGELKLLNKCNGAAITGEGGDNMGRGGRSSIYLMDEAAFVERPDKVDAAVSNNSDCKIKISTPNGPGNPFARQRNSGNFPVFRFEWMDDPRKNKWELRDENGAIVTTGVGRGAPIGALYPWYEKMKRTLDPVILAQEVDLDYNASLEGICIPAAWVMAAVELHKRLELPQRGLIIAGLDVADGGACKNVFIPRRGPVVLGIEDWAQGNTTQTAYRTRDLGQQWGIQRLNFDAGGPGTGVNGTLRSCEYLPFEIEGILGNGSCTEKCWSAFGDRESADIFKNFRAESWWLLRTRFERTYEFVNGLAVHDLDDLISIPNHGELIAQLSLPLVFYDDSGRIRIESKPEMAKRGVASPDYADALSYAFAPSTAGVWATSHETSWGY
jgi:hypothetical protein